MITCYDSINDSDSDSMLLKRSEKCPIMPLCIKSLQLQCILIARRHRVMSWRVNTAVNFASIFVKDRFQAVKNINDLFSFLWVFNSLNEDDIKNQATTKCCLSKIPMQRTSNFQLRQ